MADSMGEFSLIFSFILTDTNNRISLVASRMDLSKPLWDLNTFTGRFNHFAWVTDFRTCIKTTAELNKAKTLLEEYR